MIRVINRKSVLPQIENKNRKSISKRVNNYFKALKKDIKDVLGLNKKVDFNYRIEKHLPKKYTVNNDYVSLSQAIKLLNNSKVLESDKFAILDCYVLSGIKNFKAEENKNLNTKAEEYHQLVCSIVLGLNPLGINQHAKDAINKYLTEREYKNINKEVKEIASSFELVKNFYLVSNLNKMPSYERAYYSENKKLFHAEANVKYHSKRIEFYRNELDKYTARKNQYISKKQDIRAKGHSIEKIMELQKIAERIADLNQEIKEIERKIAYHNGENKEYSRIMRKEALRDNAQLEESYI